MAQAGGMVEGIGIAVEKGFQQGRPYYPQSGLSARVARYRGKGMDAETGEVHPLESSNIESLKGKALEPSSFVCGSGD